MNLFSGIIRLPSVLDFSVCIKKRWQIIFVCVYNLGTNVLMLLVFFLRYNICLNYQEALWRSKLCYLYKNVNAGEDVCVATLFN